MCLCLLFCLCLLDCKPLFFGFLLLLCNDRRFFHCLDLLETQEHRFLLGLQLLSFEELFILSEVSDPLLELEACVV